MALVVYDRVQQTGTANTTVSFTLSGSVTGFQSFAVVGNGNTTYYAATDASGNYEVGIGTYSTTGPTLTRTTILSSSNSNLAVTFVGTCNIFVTYPAGKSVNLDASGNVTPLGTVASGTWNGTTIGVAYGGTGVTASSGASSVVLRDANQNVVFNNFITGSTAVTAAAGTTILTVGSTRGQLLLGSTTQTFQLPDATTLQVGQGFVFVNNSSGILTVTNNASAVIDTIPSGGIATIGAISVGTSGGTWAVSSFLPGTYNFNTASADFGNATISNAVWNGTTIASGYGGTGLTTFTTANNALYSTSASALAAGTLPVAAGGTGMTTATTNGVFYGNGTSAHGVTAAGTTGQVLIATTSGAPSWGAVPSTAAVTSITFGSTGLTPSTATTGAVTVAGTLAVANGGTGVTTSTGSGNNVLSTSPSLTTPTIGGGGANFSGSTSGTTNFKAAAAAGATTITMPATTGTMALTSDIPTVNNATLTMNVSGTGLSGSQTFTANQSSAATFTVTSNATNANTASTIVARDASGNFSAGTITAALSGNASTATSATSATTATTATTANALNTANAYQGTTFTATTQFSGPGTGLTGTASSLSIGGNAATASNASLLNSISAVNLYNNMGNTHGTYTSFDSQGTSLSQGFGYRFIQGSTNSPGTNGAGQYYSWNIGLGSEYASNTYAAQFALPRNVTTPYLSVRYEEASVFGAWQKIAAGYADSAGSVTNALTMNNGGAGVASGATYNGSAAQTISYNTVGAPSITGTNASGTWGISISGNAATATTASNGGVTSIVAGSNITISGGTGAVTINATAGTATAVTLPSTNPFVQNATTLSANLTISSNNAMAAGPITINTSVTLTISTGSRVVIV